MNRIMISKALHGPRGLVLKGTKLRKSKQEIIQLW